MSSNFEMIISEISTHEPTRIPSPPANRVFDFGSDESDEDSITIETAWKGETDLQFHEIFVKIKIN